MKVPIPLSAINQKNSATRIKINIRLFRALNLSEELTLSSISANCSPLSKSSLTSSSTLCSFIDKHNTTAEITINVEATRKGPSTAHILLNNHGCLDVVPK